MHEVWVGTVQWERRWKLRRTHGYFGGRVQWERRGQQRGHLQQMTQHQQRRAVRFAAMAAGRRLC